MKTKITLSGTYKQNDLLDLEKRYNDYFNQFRKNEETLNALRDYANLEALYLHNVLLAIATMQNAVSNGGLNQLDALAQCKLDLGDYMLMNGQLWDAVLIYGQVDKAFKDNPLGERGTV